MILRITGAGICGTDATLFKLGPVVIPQGTQAAWPVVLGHEFAGEVVEVGDRVEGLKVGELVACGAGISCGRCGACQAGRTNLCTQYTTAGVHRDGGLAEYCAVPAATCEPVAAHGVHGDAAALGQPMAVAEHAVSVAGLGEGERVLVLGAGGIGAFAIWAAVCRGAQVTVFERDPARLEVAERLGAVETIAADPEAPALDQLARLEAFDVVYEMTGGQDPLDAAIAGVRPGGRVAVVGIHGEPRTVNLDRVTTQEIAMLGTMAHVRAVDLPRALDLLGQRREGWSDFASMIQPLSAVVGEDGPVFTRADAGGLPPIKTLVDPSATEPRPFR